MIKDRLKHFIENCDKTFAKNLAMDALEEIEHLEASYMSKEVTIERLRMRVKELEQENKNLTEDILYALHGNC